MQNLIGSAGRISARMNGKADLFSSLSLQTASLTRPVKTVVICNHEMLISGFILPKTCVFVC